MNSRNDDFKETLSPLMFDERLSEDPYFDEQGTDKFHIEHTQALIDKLQHLSRFGNLLTLVMGERGCGKSYLIEQLLATIHEESDVCHITAQPLLTSAQLFQQIQTEFLSETGTATDNDTFQSMLSELDISHVNRILIIDDADTLSAEVLSNLCQLSADEQEKDSPFLKIILFANHDLNLSIESAAAGVLPDTGIYTLDIPGLNTDDAYNWVKYILEQQDYQAEQDEIESLVEEGGDNFNDLKRLAEDYAQEVDEQVFDEPESEAPAVSMMGYWFAGLTIIVLAVLGGFFYQDELTELLFPPATSEPMIVEETVNVSQPLTSEESVNQTETNTTPALQATEESEIQIDEAVSDTGSQITADQMLNDDVMNEETLSEPNSGESSGTTESTEVLTESDTPIVQQDNPILEEQSVEEPPVQEQVIQQPEDIIEEPDFTSMESRLLAENETGYVVQIIGLKSTEAIEKLVNDHSDFELIYYRSLLNGKPWQIVVLSGFNSYTEANNQRQSLPDSLAVNKPWIKSIAKVKEEILTAVQ